MLAAADQLLLIGSYRLAVCSGGPPTSEKPPLTSTRPSLRTVSPWPSPAAGMEPADDHVAMAVALAVAFGEGVLAATLEQPVSSSASRS